MDPIVWLFKFLLKAAIFFTLFAFALNNQGEVTVNFFFGARWSTPLVLVVLIAFAIGLAVGVLGMVPRWWRHRRAAKSAIQESAPDSVSGNSADRAPVSRPYGL
jgi:putative membrane protein